MPIEFSNVAMAMGADDINDARGLALADFDNDGDLDMIVSNCAGDRTLNRSLPPTLLRNDLGQKRRWLAVELTGTKSNRDAVGAVVTLRLTGEAGTMTLMRHVGAGSSYASQHSNRLHFGLGQHAAVTSLEVRWPSGRKTNLSEVDADQLLHIVEDAGPR